MTFKTVKDSKLRELRVEPPGYDINVKGVSCAHHTTHFTKAVVVTVRDSCCWCLVCPLDCP